MNTLWKILVVIVMCIAVGVIASKLVLELTKPPSYHPAPITTEPRERSERPVDPKVPVLCLRLSGKFDANRWHLEKSIKAWNQNGINRLVLPKDKKFTESCITTVILKEGVITEDFNPYGYGHVEFYPDNSANWIDVWVDYKVVPVDERTRVMCHELGHVLGRPHTRDPDSCMGEHRLSYRSSRPSQLDLEIVGKSPWNYAKAAVDST